jgi:hypothetical protein
MLSRARYDEGMRDLLFVVLTFGLFAVPTAFVGVRADHRQRDRRNRSASDEPRTHRRLMLVILIVGYVVVALLAPELLGMVKADTSPLPNREGPSSGCSSTTPVRGSALAIGSRVREPTSRTSSDFPPITPDRWLENFARLGFTNDCGRSSSRRTPPGCRG